MMSSLSHPWDSKPLKLDLVYVHTWGHWWNTYLKLGGCCINSDPWPLTALLKNNCINPTHFSWSPYSPWRAGMIRRSRALIDASPYIIFWIVADPLAFDRVVLLAPPTFFPIVGIIYHSPFWTFHSSGWEIPDVGWFYLCWIPVGFLWYLLWVIH